MISFEFIEYIRKFTLDFGVLIFVLLIKRKIIKYHKCCLVNKRKSVLKMFSTYFLKDLLKAMESSNKNTLLSLFIQIQIKKRQQNLQTRLYSEPIESFKRESVLLDLTIASGKAEINYNLVIIIKHTWVFHYD